LARISLSVRFFGAIHSLLRKLDTGCGKTVTIQLLSFLLKLPLHIVNCHQTTETSDLIGGLRPVRGRSALLSKMIATTQKVLETWPEKQSLTKLDIPIFLIPQAEVMHTDDLSHLPSDAVPKIIEFVKGLQAKAPGSDYFDSKQMDRISKRPKLGDLFSPNKLQDTWLNVSKLLKELEGIFQTYNSLFEWVDGPLVQAMKRGELILLDEISLTDDAVLERLNSVLEPARTIVLAEKGMVDVNENICIKALESFQLFATMNPGGDFGKRELSPALRSRFTEIWVPPVSDLADIDIVLKQMLSNCTMHQSSNLVRPRMVEYVAWFNHVVCNDPTSLYTALSLSLRDVLTWARFVVEARQASKDLCLWDAFRHGARLMHLDGLGLGSGLSIEDAHSLRFRAETFLSKIMEEENGAVEEVQFYDFTVSENLFGLHPFRIHMGSRPIQPQAFNFGAPTTSHNVFRVLRALQVSKPVLLEGSPGVGKTTLIAAIAEASGHSLVRINLSEQTDIADLIGSDLPVPDSFSPGSIGTSFRWFDGVLLSAIKNGDWVLLDELNLASQSVLEGLNSCLDHRTSVFVPELGKSFDCPPSFRVFAAQNPMGQGGGRKGLPKSFLNRFTKVYVDSLSCNDLQVIVKSRFPEQLCADKIIQFNSKVCDAVQDGINLGREGSPWEFNLRDIFRWCELFECKEENFLRAGTSLNPLRFARDIYFQRFRTTEDRRIDI
jgi:midasin